MNTPARHRLHGFTLVELLAVLAIAAILAGTAVPSMRSFIRSVQLTSATNELFAGLTMARSEALKRSGRVALCKSSDGFRCDLTGGWEQGWIVFHDADGDGWRDEAETVLMRTQALPADLRITGNLNVAKYVSYSRDGLTHLASGAFQAGTITLCNSSAAPTPARQIVVSSAGRPRVQKVTAASCQ